MRRWAVLTVVLYLLALVALTIPVVQFCDLRGMNSKSWEPFTTSWDDLLEIYGQWAYWIWLAIFGTAQALLLLIPVDLSKRRLRPRRSLQVPLWTTAFLLGNLSLAGFFSVACALFADGAWLIFYSPAEYTVQQMEQSLLLTTLLNTAGVRPDDDTMSVLFFIGTLVLCWLVWVLVFYRYARDDQHDSFPTQATRWLLRGSILELLVAVPSHIIVRQRGDCCAPIGTFWGIATGLSIMLLTFGPGVFFLFANRLGRLKPSHRGEVPTKPVSD